jgi:hypothetical protein
MLVTFAFTLLISSDMLLMSKNIRDTVAEIKVPASQTLKFGSLLLARRGGNLPPVED